MFDFRPIRIRVIGLIVIIAALLGYFAGKAEGQAVERELPEFMVRAAGNDGNGIWILKIYHPKTQTCWIVYDRPGYNQGAGGMAPAPKEVCQ